MVREYGELVMEYSAYIFWGCKEHYPHRDRDRMNELLLQLCMDYPAEKIAAFREACMDIGEDAQHDSYRAGMAFEREVFSLEEWYQCI